MRRPFAALALASVLAAPAGAVNTLPPLFDDLQERTFRFFWETANPANGLVPDRHPTPSFSSVAAVGFGLTAYPIGVERGYITRAQARERTLATLRFFRNAPQGDARTGMAGHKGFFYHFLDMQTGQRYGNVELSTIDTALFLAGALFAQSYFDREEAEEVEIRRLAAEIYARVDWKWAAANAPAVSLGWRPEEGFIQYDWKGYNEAMLLYVLALGSPRPEHALGPEAWKAWTSTYERSWAAPPYGAESQPHLTFPSLFVHQYSHVWIDFRGIRDDYMRKVNEKYKGFDYFENSRRATYAQRDYAIANPLQCRGYGGDAWGLTASDGPVDKTFAWQGQRIPFRSYAARGMGGLQHYDDCTLAPTAVAGALPFAPEITIPAVVAMKERYGDFIYGRYGFLDAFNPSFTFDTQLQHGKMVPGKGWVAGDYLGIDQGPILAMTENHRNEFVWRVMRTNPAIRTGLIRAGFTGGWLSK
ncbi:glucoamylase family protein [Pseudoduganella umbonata]|uniref:Glycoamylase-like domain-containing protein n=1 Tax=Pseudoduganella umbonata TaxID=864828 RepID=A0A4V1EE95_9BURK|nr:glucoamylase family protein [Pseudoduganella umbonata]MBB3223285.1 hypothetical protein [Pseudoduganella umbonata]QCP13801.1 hypothetical protein FCL38_27745 [Pseudoduganella umbonata]